MAVGVARGLTDPSIVIRRATVADAAGLASFAARTFTDTYAPYNSREHVDAHLTEAFGVAQQTAELIDGAKMTVIAESPNGIVGYAQVRRGEVPECVTVDRPVEVQRFYVDRTAHGTGIAQLLMAEALRAAHDLGGHHAWLGVWEQNARAIAFYRKAGFQDVGTHDFYLGPDRQTDRVLVIPVPPHKVEARQPRVLHLGLLVATVAIGIATRRYPTAFPSLIARYGGDALWAGMVFWVIVLVRPAVATRHAAIIALAIAFSVELSQLYQVPWIDAVRASTIGSLVLGHGFLWTDLVCYSVGVTLMAALDGALRRSRTTRAR
ncbi:MAG: GNAT family N-acetyltransferase [Gemmatimonadaceae bacterium]